MLYLKNNSKQCLLFVNKIKVIKLLSLTAQTKIYLPKASNTGLPLQLCGGVKPISHAKVAAVS